MSTPSPPSPPHSTQHQVHKLSSTDSNSSSISTSHLLMMDMTAATPKNSLYESSIVKLPRHSLGLPRTRYLILTMPQPGRVALQYYKDEFAYTSYQNHLGDCDLLPSSLVKRFNGPFSRDICLQLTFSKTPDSLAITDAYTTKHFIDESNSELFFRCESEESRSSWLEEITRAINYIKYVDSNPRTDDSSGASTSPDDDATDDTSSLTNTDEGTDDGDIELMDDLDLNDMLEIEEKVVTGLRSSNNLDAPPPVPPISTTDIKDAAASAEEERFVNGTRSFISKSDKDLEAQECSVLIAALAAAKIEAKTALNPLSRKRAKKRTELLLRKTKACKNWAYLAIRFKLTTLAREQDLPKIKRFLERVPATGYFAQLVRDILPNCVRAACKNRDQKMVDYFVTKQNVDVNTMNALGIPLIHFAMIGDGDPTDTFEESMALFMHMHQVLKGDPYTYTHTGQHLMFFLIVGNNNDTVTRKLDYCVDELKLDPRCVDKYGVSLLHWCVLYNNRIAMEHIYNKGWEVHSRAKWRSNMELFSRAGFIPDAIAQASSEWRSRGLLKYANSASPLGVAILHNNGSFAKYLMGLGSQDCQCTKRHGLFQDNCGDLEMAAIAWPELLPEVLESFGELQDSYGDVGPRKKNTVTYENNQSGESGGYIKKRYAIQDMLGNPATAVNKSPLSILARTNSPEVFDAPIMKLIIQIKWNSFGRHMFMMQFMPYLLVLVTAWIGFQDLEAPLYFGIRCFTYAGTFYLIFCEEMREAYREGFLDFVKSPWNYFSLPAYIGILYAGVCHDILSQPESPDLDIIKAAATFSLMLRALEFMIILSSTSLFVVTVRMLIRDIVLWGYLFVFFIVAFGFSFYVLLKGEENFETIAGTLVTVFRMSIGDFDYPFSEDEMKGQAATVLWIVYTFIVNLLYLNVLIAMMSKSFEKVEDAASGMASLALAKSLVTWEATISKKSRRQYYEELIPPPEKKRIVKLVLTEGIGYFTWLWDLMGEGDATAMSLTVDDGDASVYTKVEKDWKQIEEDEIAEREEFRKRMFAKMCASMGEMKSMMGEVKEMMVNAKEESKGEGGEAEVEAEAERELVNDLMKERKGRRKSIRKREQLKSLFKLGGK